MAEDWAIDVRKYAPDADDAVIAGIVKYCGIALRSRDSSLVAFSDPAETALVRENYCRKKLGLTQSDEELDVAVASLGERMKEDRTKNRVTVYYLLAESFGKLGVFGGTASVATAATAAPVEPVAFASSSAGTSAAAAPAMASAALPVGAATQTQTQTSDRDDGGIFGTAFATLGVVGAIFLVTATLGSLIGDRVAPVPELPAGPDTAPVVAVAAPVAAPDIPEGSGVVAQDVAGKPQVSVYFDTASSVVSPDFATATGPIKAWMAAHPGARLAVSGFNDPSGNAAFNAELSKKRAQSVAAALAAQGVPADAIDLEKPPETTDTSTTQENARRVDIIVKDGS